MKKQFKHIVKIERIEIKVNKDNETKCHEECDYYSQSKCHRYGYFNIFELDTGQRHKECINEMGMPSEEENQ